MKFLLIQVVSVIIFLGCISTGPKSGLSPQDAKQLTVVGDSFTKAFQREGSSIEVIRPGQLDVKVISEDFRKLDVAASARAREMASWLWSNFGRQAGLESIRIRPDRCNLYDLAESSLNLKGVTDG